MVPFITPFQTGEVTSYNCLTVNIVLITVLEYPILLPTTDYSQYKEDGTLEIHYSPLSDAGLFKGFGLFPIIFSLIWIHEKRKEPLKSKLLVGAATMLKNSCSPRKNQNASGGFTWEQIKQIINNKWSEID